MTYSPDPLVEMRSKDYLRAMLAQFFAVVAADPRVEAAPDAGVAIQQIFPEYAAVVDFELKLIIQDPSLMDAMFEPDAEEGDNGSI